MSVPVQDPSRPTAGKTPSGGQGMPLAANGQQAKGDDDFQDLLSGLKKPGSQPRQPEQQNTNEIPSGDAGQTGPAVNMPQGSVGQVGSQVENRYRSENFVSALRSVSQIVHSNSMGAANAEPKVPGSIGENSPEAAKHPGAETVLPSEAFVLNTGVPLPGSIGAGLRPLDGPDPERIQSLHSRQQGQHPNVLSAYGGITTGMEVSKGATGTSSLFAQFGVEPKAVSDAQVAYHLTGSSLPEDVAETVKVLKQETHFAPNLRLSPAQQVGEQLSLALKEVLRDFGSFPGGLNTKAEGPVLKTLDIQLTPHELGTVKVSLRMVGDTVDVSLVASKQQTADLLKQDRQLLDQMLKVTGFKAESVTVTNADDRTAVLTPNSTQPGAGQNGSMQNGDQQSSGQQFGGAGHNPDKRGTQDDQPATGFPEERTSLTNGDADEEDTDLSLSDGIYL